MPTDLRGGIALVSAFLWVLPVCAARNTAVFDPPMYEFVRVADVPVGAAHIQAVRQLQEKVFYVSAGARVFRVFQDGEVSEACKLPARVVQLVRTGEEVIAVTEAGRVYAVRESGPDLLSGESIVRFVAFTSLSLYQKKPYGLVWRRDSPPRVCRFSAFLPGPFATLTVEERLSGFWKSAVAWDFCEIPGVWSLLALSDRGLIWRVDSLGETKLWVADRRLKGARFFTWDRLGIYGGVVLVVVPGSRRIYRITPGGAVEPFLKKVRTRPGEALGGITVGPDGVAYVVLGSRIYGLKPKSGTRFARTVPQVRKALELFDRGRYSEARAVVLRAGRALAQPPFWVRRIKRVKASCDAALALQSLELRAAKAGYGSLYRAAVTLSERYGGLPLLAQRINSFVRKCRHARGIFSIGDFEDPDSDQNGGEVPMPAAIGSKARRAARPEPVKEGLYSLKWIVPAGRRGQRLLIFHSANWPQGGELKLLKAWIYSPRQDYRIRLSITDVLDVVVSQRLVELDQGWQETTWNLGFLKSIVGGLVFEAFEGSSVELYLDGICSSKSSK